jgi:hypothetical protein
MSTKGNIQNPENTKNEKTKRFIPNLTERVFSQKYKGEAIFNIVTMINLGIITQEDLADFSNDLKESVQELINRNYGKW